MKILCLAVCGMCFSFFISVDNSNASEAKPIQAGEKVIVDFTCYLPNGELAASTDPKLSEQTGVVASKIFRKKTNPSPLLVSAGKEEAASGQTKILSFEDEIISKIAQELVGMETGEARATVISSEVDKSLRDDERYLEVSRVRYRPKELRMSKDRFRSETGKEPQVGIAYTIDPALPGRIESIGDQEVTIIFPAQAGNYVQTPIGRGMVRDGGKQWEIHLDVQKGDLIRTGPLVGRVTDVTERLVIIDYGHRLGGEVLNCTIIPINPEEVKE